MELRGLNIFLNDTYIASKKPYKISAYSQISKKPSLGCKLEDIHSNPKATLLKICN